MVVRAEVAPRARKAQVRVAVALEAVRTLRMVAAAITRLQMIAAQATQVS